MRSKKIIAAASIATIGLAVTAALSGAPAARADVGDVDLTYFNASGAIIGTDEDVFANLFTAQCDNNQTPSGTVTVEVVNLSDEEVYVGASCDGGSGPGQAISPLGSYTFGGSPPFLDVYAPAGA
jgi:hypothetical protein